MSFCSGKFDVSYVTSSKLNGCERLTSVVYADSARLVLSVWRRLSRNVTRSFARLRVLMNTNVAGHILISEGNRSRCDSVWSARTNLRHEPESTSFVAGRAFISSTVARTPRIGRVGGSWMTSAMCKYECRTIQELRPFSVSLGTCGNTLW